MLDQFNQHIGEEHANRAIMIEMRDTLHRLGEMHHGITSEEHQTLFDWWREHVAASKVRAERWEKVKQTAIGYAVVALLGSIVTLGQPVGRAVLEHWNYILNRLK